MALTGAQILTQAGLFVLDRVQSAGPGDISITRDKVYELGNGYSIGTTKGVPQVTYDIESFDTTAEFEAYLIGEDPRTFSSSVGSNEIDFGNAIPIDIISPMKASKNSEVIAAGAIAPYLTLSSARYRFGVGENATQNFSMNGDASFITPGQPYIEEFTNTGAGPYTLARAAETYTSGGDTIYVTSVCLFDSTTKAYKRVYFDSEAAVDTPTAPTYGYTNPTNTTLYLYDDLSSTYDTVRVTYSTQTKENYSQTGNTPYGTVTHATTSVKPAAVRSQDLDVYIGTPGATPVWSRLTSVQNIEASWSVNLENDEELGNRFYVSSDYDVPEVSGSIGIKPINVTDLVEKVTKITGVTAGEIIGPDSSVAVPIEMRISHPTTGARLKTIYVPDAIFNIPGLNGQVQTKLESTLSWTSDSGTMKVYNGSRI